MPLTAYRFTLMKGQALLSNFFKVAVMDLVVDNLFSVSLPCVCLTQHTVCFINFSQGNCVFIWEKSGNCENLFLWQP